VWADFDNDGDLVVCWRDRRNASGSTYSVPTEIYCAVRRNGQPDFEEDYSISSLQVDHNVVLEDKGNDFMNVALLNDTAYAIWGDVRSGSLKIYLNKWNINSQSSSIHEVYSQNENIIYPNPTTGSINLPVSVLNSEYYLYNVSGNILDKGTIKDQKFDLNNLKNGNYFFKIVDQKGVSVYKFQIQN